MIAALSARAERYLANLVDVVEGPTLTDIATAGGGVNTQRGNGHGAGNWRRESASAIAHGGGLTT